MNVKRFVFIIYVAVIGVLVTATVLEKIYGTPFVMEHIYGAWWFIALWGLLGMGCIVTMISKWQKAKGEGQKGRGFFQLSTFNFQLSILLHLSFVIILIGALVTHLYGLQGSVHLRTGESTTMMLNDEKKMVEELPFALRLVDFQLQTYPGTQAPKDYCSDLVIEGTNDTLNVSMNKIGEYQSYRFYQSGYDSDLEGTYLAVSHDPWGIGITYTGYALLLVSMLWNLMAKGKWLKAKGEGQNWLAVSGKWLVGVALCFLPFAFVSCTALQPFAERVYALFNHLRPLAIVLLCVGFVNYIFSLVYTSRQRSMPRWFTIQLPIFCIVAFVYLLLFVTLRTIIAGHIPLTNGFEVMLFMSMLSLAMASSKWLKAKGEGQKVRDANRSTLTANLIIAGLALLVATLSQSDSQIEPIAPVLDSPLLSIHVSLVMLSYTLFAFLAISSLTALIQWVAKGKGQKAKDKENLEGLRFQLKLAVFLLAAGIILGAIWANQSWGRYWGWDPKEVWALITLMVYAIPLHVRSKRPSKSSLKEDFISSPFKGDKRGSFFYHLYLVLAFLSVIITYFGVNFFLGGMHSYANG